MKLARAVVFAALLVGLASVAAFDPKSFCGPEGLAGGWTALDVDSMEVRMELMPIVEASNDEWFASNATIPCTDVYETRLQAACRQVVAGTNYMVAYTFSCILEPSVKPILLATSAYVPLPGSGAEMEVDVPEVIN